MWLRDLGKILSDCYGLDFVLLNKIDGPLGKIEQLIVA